ncbi:hypothetical protein AGABI1DRAFT_78341 [Agaricus bisporus var. burnettii JB137-S8]|uniref:Uncharacterized protein n=1 Tax=Agaricus bisporus var. burnettii (strain JB137-S8 / ATCC MYA-4627 / FGSC 10392) TaxID=597362 RepID=K5X148_AGABU|nr:uncharacterized protein AGABI1DRAFT_78341 [Agaricus bisporus var. burnettii JB137-S8]EKM76597.1 hypothetical protein AGABI1DRAFT_78341 [Agaricus bisporus var. burnettii JB137-S8]
MTVCAMMSGGKTAGRSSLLDALDESLVSGSQRAVRQPSLAPMQSQSPEESEEDESSSAYANSQFLLKMMDVKPSASQPSPAGVITQRRNFNLFYDQETPLKPIEFGGADQEEKLAEFVTKAIDNVSHGLSVQTAIEKLGLECKQDYLPGLEVRLLAHQAIGVAWMLEQEKGPHKGGILADDMGLGKTVQMIATMVKNMPDIEDDHRTTLVVVPAALLQQWKDEIEAKTNGLFSVHIHHGKDKLRSSSAVKSMDVVITSYQTLHADFHSPSDVDPQDEYNWLVKYGGPLARTKFFRVIADEAQFIRNRATRASISLAYVRAKYRWMLTGTPVTNTLVDLYGLLRFGRFRPFNDWDSFNSHIAKVQMNDALLAGTRAQAILKPILLRRTKDSNIEGVPILQLPPKDVELVKLKFSEQEREIYNSFETRSKITINKFIRNNTLVKSHHIILVLILRLRQLCCHPHLILSQTEDFSDPTVLMADECAKELARAKKEIGGTLVAEIKQRFLLRKAADELVDFNNDDADIAGTSECPKCSDMLLADNGRILGCGHEICFDCTLNLKNSAFEHDGIFGYGNEKQNDAVEKMYEMAQVKGWRPCPTCGEMIDLGPQKTFKWAAFEPSDRELYDYDRAKKEAKRKLARRKKESPRKPSLPSKPSSSRDIMDLSDSEDELPSFGGLGPSPKRRKKSHDHSSDDDTRGSSVSRGKLNKSQVASQNEGAGTSMEGLSGATVKTWSRGNNDMVSSTKMVEMTRLLKKWEASGDKIIVYSQWTSMLDLIEIEYSHHGIDSLRFDGKMNKTSKDEVLAQFKQQGGPKVILISTKCGSVGLNLVAANRVINMDLSWNYAAESQAYDRCHRIGQEKNVFVKRLVVEDTIEERMLKLQEVKMGLSDAALGEGSGIKLSTLSVKDIKYLFGMTKSKPAKEDGTTQTQLPTRPD